MPTKEHPSLKDSEIYEALRDDGGPVQGAARISNAAVKKERSAAGQKGGKPPDYEDWTMPELEDKAKEIGFNGYS